MGSSVIRLEADPEQSAEATPAYLASRAARQHPHLKVRKYAAVRPRCCASVILRQFHNSLTSNLAGHLSDS